jgi:hypothetical protein
MLSQIQLQRPSEQLQQHLKAHFGNRRIIPSLAELIANKRIYVPSVSNSSARNEPENE